jgi:hypothetical protein
MADFVRPATIEFARRVLQDVLLKGDCDPPGSVGGEPDNVIGIEPADRAHQSQLALAGEIVPRHAGRAMDLRQLQDETTPWRLASWRASEMSCGLASDGTTSHPLRFRGCSGWCGTSPDRTAWSRSFLTSDFTGAAGRFSAHTVPNGRGGRAASHGRKVRRRIVEDYPRGGRLRGAPRPEPRSCSRGRGYL